MEKKTDVGRISWSYKFDINGNVVAADFGIGVTEFVLEHGSRVSSVAGKHGVEYDGRGFLVARHNFTFQYSPDGRLLVMRLQV